MGRSSISLIKRVHQDWHMMRPFALLVAFVPLNVFAIVADFGISYEKASFNFIREHGLNYVTSILTDFSPTLDAAVMFELLKCQQVPYQEIYDGIRMSAIQQSELFKSLFDVGGSAEHQTFFSLAKIRNNPELAEEIFLKGIALDKSNPEVKSTVYRGNFFGQGSSFSFEDVYAENEELAMAMIRFVISEQMAMVDRKYWLRGFVSIAKEAHAKEIFQLLLDKKEMTPDMIATFFCWGRNLDATSLIASYTSTELRLTHEEHLIRCALLPNLNPPVNLATCSEFQAPTHIDELQRIALKLGDRQSLSSLFYHKCLYQSDSVTVSEMLKYLQLGKLSPATTDCFTNLRVFKKSEHSDWPVTHLHFEELPKEQRLTKWLLDSVSYMRSPPVKAGSLYSGAVNYLTMELLVNLQLIVPKRLDDGRITTRAADIFIRNAQATLDANRDNQQSRKALLIGEEAVILLGTLYALADRQHLDFSNTVVEALVGDTKWDWFDSVLDDSKFGDMCVAHAAWVGLGSAEIYNYVHRASSSDEQVDKIAAGVEAPSISMLE
jgi:hypothetical protein